MLSSLPSLDCYTFLWSRTAGGSHCTFNSRHVGIVAQSLRNGTHGTVNWSREPSKASLCMLIFYVRVGIWIAEKSLFICAKRMSWGTGVNFYGRSGSAGTGGLTSASSQTAAADAKLDGIYNLLMSQNQHMLATRAAGSSRDWAFE